LQAEDILHVVEAGGSPVGPLRCAQGTSSERLTRRCVVGQFHALAVCSEDHGMIPYDVATPYGVHANFPGGAFADDAVPPVADVLLVLKLATLCEGLREALRRAARGVFLHPVMHLDDFEIEGGAQDFRRTACEPEERVYSDTVVRCENDRNLTGGVPDTGHLRVGVAGRSDHQCFLVFDAACEHQLDRIVMREIDDRVAPRNSASKIVALVDFRYDLKIGVLFRTGNEHLAHAPFGTIDKETN